MSCENVSSVGEVRKKYLRPRVVSAGCEDSAFRNGTPARSAAWLAAAVTEEKYAPNTACTFSCEMRRSVSLRPTSGLPW
jgi:hypothetical protein